MFAGGISPVLHSKVANLDKLDRTPVLTTRTFPIRFDQTSGDIVYPSLAYPERGWILPTWAAACLSVGIPLAVYAAAQVRMRSAWDADGAVMGTVWAVLLATLFQVCVKTAVGGLRPYFLDVCKPDLAQLARVPGRDATGLNGVGFGRIMYTADVCTERDPAVLRNAMTSFPSGHSAAGFAGYGFLHLWLNARLKAWADYRPALWKLLATLAPLLGALLNACLLNANEAHHWYDILAGCLIGVAMALAAFRATHAAVWDPRYNHLCLHPRHAFLYGADDTCVDYAGRTLTARVGWGGDRAWVGSPRQDEAAVAAGVGTDGTAENSFMSLHNSAVASFRARGRRRRYRHDGHPASI